MTYKRASRVSAVLDEANSLIGQRLNAIRRKLNLSQSQVAEQLGLALRTYQNYEQGEREISARALMNAANEFQVEAQWLYFGPGIEPRYIGAPSRYLELAVATYANVDVLVSRLKAKLPRETKDKIFEAALVDALKDKGADLEQVERIVKLAS